MGIRGKAMPGCRRINSQVAMKGSPEAEGRRELGINFALS